MKSEHYHAMFNSLLIAYPGVIHNENKIHNSSEFVNPGSKSFPLEFN